MPQRHVTIIQRAIPNHRIAFFSQVDERARRFGLRVTVFCAEPPRRGKPVGFCYRVLPARLLGAGPAAPYWLQGLAKAVRGSDVVVAPQELRCLNIPVLWAVRRRICRRWIWWGTGYNFEAGEAWSPWMQGRVNGVRAAAPAIPYRRLAALQRELGLDGKWVLLFCGRLDADNEVGFLLRTLRRLRRRVPTALLIIGDGSARLRLEALAAELRLESVQFLGEERDPGRLGAYFGLTDLVTIPGLVALPVVQGFAFGLPLATTLSGRNSREIEYLWPDTGVIAPHDEEAYAATIERLLRDPTRLARMRRQAAQRADRLRLAASADRFVDAIRALPDNGAPPARAGGGALPSRSLAHRNTTSA
jgi:glycosyltransferase involved in cell wall biosynthesis